MLQKYFTRRLLMLCLIFCCLAQTTEVTLPFVKLDTMAFNPVIGEKYLYREELASKLTRSFKECPVYYVVYKDKQEQLIQVGSVSCVFKGGPDPKWMSASMKISKQIPRDYVLRAKFVATESKQGKSGVLEVIDANITEFYLKPKEKSTIFD